MQIVHTAAAHYNSVAIIRPVDVNQSAELTVNSYPPKLSPGDINSVVIDKNQVH